jgi:integrase
MGTIETSSNGNLYFDFEYQGVRCMEYTSVVDTPKNRNLMNDILKRIEAEISLGIFDYGRYFPKSYNARKLNSSDKGNNEVTFEQYAESWFRNNKVSWKPSSQRVIRCTLNKYLIPYFGVKPVTQITKAMIKEFRTGLGLVDGRRGNKISHIRINHIVEIFRMVMNDVIEEYGIDSRFLSIKPLKVIKPSIMPFSMEEVNSFLRHVPARYYDYYVVRFFSGMRTAEIDGLKWKYVDFISRKIRVRETWENRTWVSPKSESSIRDIDMSPVVEEALHRQKVVTGNGEIVFTTRRGKPMDHDDLGRRIWYPTLKKAGLASRTPRHTRHTAATLWLASGENPEWVARQLGHANTAMLFNVYSKFIPNLTRRDGSAFEKILYRKLHER